MPYEKLTDLPDSVRDNLAQARTSLSWSELAELSLQKESSNSTALLVSFINKPYQVSRAQTAPPEVPLKATTS